MFKLTIRRLMRSIGLLVSLLIGVGLCLVHLFTQVLPRAKFNLVEHDTLMPGYYPHSLFRWWLGADLSSLAGSLWLLLLPLLVVLPGSALLFDDRRSGYGVNLLTRTSKLRVVATEALATFLVGGGCVVLPLLLDFFLTAWWLPALRPIPSTGEVTIFATAMWANLYYAHPLGYVLQYLALIFCWCGAIAMGAFALGCVTEKRWLVMFGPFVLLWGIEFLLAAVFPRWRGCSPLSFLRPDQFSDAFGVAIVVEWLLIMVLSSVSMIRWARRHESIGELG